MTDQTNLLNLDKLDAFIVDMDGVVTRTARIHALAWKRMFDEYLQSRSKIAGESLEPFDIHDDYLEYVDGKPRYDGVRSFLDSRGISLDYGSPDDSPLTETVCGLGNRKNGYFLKLLEERGAKPVDSTIEFLRSIRSRGIRVAVISASRNAAQVLKAAGVEDLFDAAVDGVESDRLDLAGKPEPDIFIEAARRLDTHPHRAAVVEDAQSGIRAGKSGGFSLVIGLDAGNQRKALLEAGADLVVDELTDLHLKERN